MKVFLPNINDVVGGNTGWIKQTIDLKHFFLKFISSNNRLSFIQMYILL